MLPNDSVVSSEPTAGSALVNTYIAELANQTFLSTVIMHVGMNCGVPNLI